jgi:CheY-like chemotaxis protein
MMPEMNDEKCTRCLVVDDEPAIVRLVAIVLRDLGCRPVTTGDAESALRLWESDSPDVVISDVRLPGMDGVELARIIKSKENGHGKTPVLLMSAYAEPRNHAADAFLAKPFDIDGLVDFVSPYVHSET